MHLPYLLQIEPTSYCNLKCRMCPLTARNTISSLRPGHMEEATWEQVLVMAQQVRQVLLTGFGETLSHPRFLSFARELDALGVRMSFSTNAVQVKPELARELARLRHLIHVNVSIDSPDPAVYREIRGGILEKALVGLRNLAAALPPEKLTVSSVMMVSNLETLVAFPPLLAEIGIRRYSLQGMQELVASLSEERVARAREARKIVARIEAACAQAGVELRYGLPDRLALELYDPDQAQARYFEREPGGDQAGPLPTRQCHLPWEVAYVDKDGRVFPCCYASTGGAPALGYLQEQPLETIWNGPALKQFREDLLDGRSIPAVCRSCVVAPWGEHFLHAYQAQLLPEQSRLNQGTEMLLKVQNTGTATWTSETRIYIGTAAPRDHSSPYHHPRWLDKNRVTSFREKAVAPGEMATFEFPLQPVWGVNSEMFQLVVEGVCWLPSTYFAVHWTPKLMERPFYLAWYVLGRLWTLLGSLLHSGLFFAKGAWGFREIYRLTRQ